MAEFSLFTSLRYDPTLLQVPNAGYNHAGWNQQPSPFYMLDLHRDRLLRAAQYWQWASAIEKLSGDAGLERLHDVLRQAIVDIDPKPRRLRVVVQRNGELSCTVFTAPVVPLNNLFPDRLPPTTDDEEVVVDPLRRVSAQRYATYHIKLDSRGTAKSEFTHYKTTRRDAYDDATARTGVGLNAYQEVLLLNSDDDSIMEGSCTTPYFFRRGRWVTPPVPPTYTPNHEGSGGNDGTTRRWALETYDIVHLLCSLFCYRLSIITLTGCCSGLAVEEPVLASSLAHGEECWISNGVRGFMFGRIELLT